MKRYNLRVYGIIINENDEVLVSDERRYGRSFTKFPGGGLEWGEGLKEGLEREIEEELKLNVSIGDLVYVNDFFQVSAFKDTDQLISFYFRVEDLECDKVPISNHEIPLTEEGERFRWVKLNELKQSDFTFPIDKVVAELIAT